MSEGKHRIAVGGIHIESSTFSPHRAGTADFTITRGDDLLARYARMPQGARWIPLVHARALPGGAVTAEFFSQTMKELLDGLRQAHEAEPLDGVYLDIHGAMSVEGVVDAEGLLASKVRQVVGPEVLVSASMDPHGNVSRRLVDNVDLLTSHRMSPHEDSHLTLQRAMDNLVHCLDNSIRPVRAWVTVPVLLPGERACTRDEPAKGLYGELPAVESQEGVIDAAIWIGYAWADEPRCRGAVVVSGTDRTLVTAEASRLAQGWWDARADFDFSTRAVDTDTAIAEAVDSPQRPYFVSDSGDNPTAGGSGDVPFTASRLLAHPGLASGEKTAIWAAVVDPEVVARCVTAGVGAAVECRIGGALGWDGGASIEVKGQVAFVLRGDQVGGDIVVIGCGGVSLIVTSRRKPYHYISDFTALGLDPSNVDVTVVKVGYLVPDLFDAAAGWVMALSPGGVDQDIVRLGHQGVERPIYPLDAEADDPGFVPELFVS